ncbi:hypothetical protein BJX70DRAFT_378414 [Aspergillus crustosus]
MTFPSGVLRQSSTASRIWVAITNPACAMGNLVVVSRWKTCGFVFAGVSSMWCFMNQASGREHFCTIAASSGYREQWVSRGIWGASVLLGILMMTYVLDISCG